MCLRNSLIIDIWTSKFSVKEWSNVSLRSSISFRGIGSKKVKNTYEIHRRGSCPTKRPHLQPHLSFLCTSSPRSVIPLNWNKVHTFLLNICCRTWVTEIHLCLFHTLFMTATYSCMYGMHSIAFVNQRCEVLQFSFLWTSRHITRNTIRATSLGE